MSLSLTPGSLPHALDGLDLSALGPLSPRCQSSGEFRLYRSRSHVYWLLNGGTAGRSAAAFLYSPQKLSGDALRLWMRLGAPPVARISLDQPALQELKLAIGRTAGILDPVLSFAIGPPRPANKVVAAVMDRAGRAMAFAKLAPPGDATRVLIREARTLDLLSNLDSLRDRVPRLLGRTRSLGYEVIILSPGPAKSGPRRPGQMHLSFLAALDAETSDDAPFAELPQVARMSRNLEIARRSLRRDELSRYERALELLHAEFGSSSLHGYLAHCDFVPWNTRTTESDLWVLDWESAQAGTLAAADAFHFEFVPDALKGTETGSMNFASVLLSRVWPEGRELVEHLRLAHLLDVSLQYARELGEPGRDRQNPILERAWEAIDQSLNRFGR